MQITLKQSDIEQALKGHIKAQGINLTGKVVSMAFTAGRKQAGISVELTISEAVAQEAAAPIVLAAASEKTAEESINTAAPVLAAVETQAEPEGEEPAVAPTAQAPAEGKVSLFGN